VTRPSSFGRQIRSLDTPSRQNSSRSEHAQQRPRQNRKRDLELKRISRRYKPRFANSPPALVTVRSERSSKPFDHPASRDAPDSRRHCQKYDGSRYVLSGRDNLMTHHRVNSFTAPPYENHTGYFRALRHLSSTRLGSLNFWSKLSARKHRDCFQHGKKHESCSSRPYKNQRI
jgi:hypothetical protein